VGNEGKPPIGWQAFFAGLLSFGEDIYLTLGRLPFYLAVAQGIKGEVAALANIFTGMKAGAALTEKNGSGVDGLAVVALYAKTLAVAVASVSTGSLSFFMCHDGCLSGK
jgi:hypothetical protein